MGHDHNHAPSEIRHEKPFWWALALTGSFLVAEIVGAFATGTGLTLRSNGGELALPERLGWLHE